MSLATRGLWITMAVCMLASGAEGYLVPPLKGPHDLQGQLSGHEIVAKVHVDSVEKKGATRLDFTPALVMEAHCTVVSAIKGEPDKTMDIAFVVEEKVAAGAEWGMPSLEKDETAVVFVQKDGGKFRLGYPTVPGVAEAITYTHGKRPSDKLLDELLAWASVEGKRQGEAIEQLGVYADERAAEVLRKLMGTVKPELRAVVMAALIRVNAAPALEEIKKYSTDADVTRAIYDRSAHPVNDPKTGRPRSPFRRGVTGLDYSAYLRECLPLVKPEQVESVMYAAWQVNRDETVPVLVGLLDDKSAEVRRWAVGCLKQIVEHDNRVPDAAEFARTGAAQVKSWKDWWASHEAAFIAQCQPKYLVELAEGLASLADERLPGHAFDFGQDRVIRVKWKTQEYDVHRPTGKDKDAKTEVRHETGPAADGVILTAWLSSEIGQADRPQTLDNDGKWKTDLGQVNLPWLKTYLFFNLDYGPKADAEVVKLLATPEKWRLASRTYGQPQTQPASRP
jgi:hypothetical protein